MTALHEVGVTQLHGLGVMLAGLRRYGHLLTSADSMAWSVEAGLDVSPSVKQLGFFAPSRPRGLR